MRIEDGLKESNLNISNTLSVLRILLLPVFVIYSRDYVADPARDDLFYPLLGIILIGSLSDFLDGYLARLLNQETILGRYLDPVADKLTGTVALVTLVLYYGFPLWILIVHIGRELGGIWMGTFLFFRRQMQGRPNIWGKLGVTLTAICVLWYVLCPRLRTLSGPDTDAWYLHPEVAANTLAAVLAIGMAAYWKTYWNVIFRDPAAPGSDN